MKVARCRADVSRFARTCPPSPPRSCASLTRPPSGGTRRASHPRFDTFAYHSPPLGTYKKGTSQGCLGNRLSASANTLVIHWSLRITLVAADR